MLFELGTSGFTKAIKRALAVLKAFSLQLPDGSAMTIDVEPLLGRADSGILSEDLTDLLSSVGKAARSQEAAVLVAIDEVQYLSEDELAALITAIHRTNQLDLPVVLVGAGLPQLPALTGEAKSYAERLFDFPVIGALAPDDAKAALVIPAQEEGVRFTKEALDLVVEESNGYPYFLQEWGYHVWNYASESLIDAGTVRGAKDQVVDQLERNFFLVRFDQLTPMEKEYLRAMADLGPGPHRSGDIAKRLRVKVQSVAPRRSGLISKGMIYSPSHGETAFTVPLFDEYLHCPMPGWVPRRTNRSR